MCKFLDFKIIETNLKRNHCQVYRYFLILFCLYFFVFEISIEMCNHYKSNDEAYFKYASNNATLRLYKISAGRINNHLNLQFLSVRFAASKATQATRFYRWTKFLII